MVYVLPYLCLLAAILSALRPALPSCVPTGNHTPRATVISPGSDSPSAVTSPSPPSSSPAAVRSGGGEVVHGERPSAVSTASVGATTNHSATTTGRSVATASDRTRSLAVSHSDAANLTANADLVAGYVRRTRTYTRRLHTSGGTVVAVATHTSSSETWVASQHAQVGGRVARSLRSGNPHNDTGDAAAATADAAAAAAAVVEDTAGRNERSTNLSHITGTSRKIQMYITNRHLQILPDGTVNGTGDDTSDYTILQRESSGVGQLRILGVASCQYLCIDACGLLYGSRQFNPDCVFNEMIEDNHYNTYSSHRYSNRNRTMYVAMNRRGQPRKVLIRTPTAAGGGGGGGGGAGGMRRSFLGKMATYTRVLTKPVPAERVDALHAHMASVRPAAGQPPPMPMPTPMPTSTPHPLRHHGFHQLCPPPRSDADGAAASDAEQRKSPQLRCRTKRKKRKKKRRKCGDRDNDEASALPKHRKHLQNTSKISGAAISAKSKDQEATRPYVASTPATAMCSEISNSSTKCNSSVNGSGDGDGNIESPSPSPSDSYSPSNNHSGSDNDSDSSSHQHGDSSNNRNGSATVSHKKHFNKSNSRNKKQFTFMFNGAIVTDCETFKNLNKRRKCEQALVRQRTKFGQGVEPSSHALANASSNFHVGEVDARRRKAVGDRSHEHGLRSDSQRKWPAPEESADETEAPRDAVASLASAASAAPTPPVFGYALPSSSSRLGDAETPPLVDEDYEWASAASHDTAAPDEHDDRDDDRADAAISTSPRHPHTPRPPPVHDSDDGNDEDSSIFVDD